MAALRLAGSALVTLGPGRLALLGALVFFAGVVDSLAGGGGLITLPAYLAAGLDPALVLGTNKLASSIGTTAACLNYQRRHRLAPSDLAWPTLSCLIGAFLGARLAVRIGPAFIRAAILVILPILASLLLRRRRFGERDDSARHSTGGLRLLMAGISLPLGFYDGLFGPGTGTFMALALARVCGFDLLAATTRAKWLNLATNMSALLAFSLAGRVDRELGLAMGLASVCGNVAGSHLGLKRGAHAIRPAVIAVCAALFVKLLLDSLR